MKFKNKKLVIIMNGILIVIILSTISGISNNSESSEKKLIIVGGEYDYPPYSFLDPKGKPAGFSVELTIAVARAMGLDVEINLTPWSQARKSLEDSKIDIILGMFYSPEREQIFDFSTPFSVVNNTIFARKGSSKIQSIEEIRNKEIIVMEGEIMHDFAIKNKLTDRLLLSKTPSDAMRLLASGKGDCALIAYTPGLYWIKTLNLSNIIPVGPPVMSFKNCFVVHKGNTILLQKFNEGLNILYKTGEYQKLYDKWLGVLEPSPTTFKQAIKYIAMVVIPLILLLVFSLLWSWILRSVVKQKTEELIKAKEKAEESEIRLRALSDNIPNGLVYQIDSGIDARQRRFSYISAGVERLHGITADDALNDAMAIYGQVVEEDRHILAEREAVAATNLSQFNAELRFQLPSGKIRWGNITSAPRRLPNNHLIWDGIEIDITERKKTQDTLKESEAKLQQAQKMEAIGVLAGGIAHDFNNILSPIIGHTEMLSDDIPKDSPLRSSLDEIYAASMRAKDMVRQILTFARQEKGEVKLMKMQHIVKEALKLIRSTIPATIDIKENIRKECGLINADPTQIHQIVMNLATNAYHAMEETGGTMTISLKEVELNPKLNEQDLICQDLICQDIQKGIYACLTVADTGTGVPEHIKDKIFDPFFTTKKQGKGTGLGLSSVHGIVTSCGGFIRLNSEIGKGTEFNIYLPVAESYLKKDDVLQAKIPMQGGNERILIVDDEIVLITLQKGMLERLGYHVTSRTSSIEALEAFRANPDKFDMVITDMAMPNVSGDKLAVELIKIRPDIPILLSTGFSTIMSEEKALSMGIKGFLMKPVAIRDIDKKIRDVLDKK